MLRSGMGAQPLAGNAHDAGLARAWVERSDVLGRNDLHASETAMPDSAAPRYAAAFGAQPLAGNAHDNELAREASLPAQKQHQL